MKRGLLVVAISAVLVGSLAGLAAARSTTTVAMSARLKVVKLAAQKLPNASGRFSGTLLQFSNGRSKLTWRLTISNLGQRAHQAELLVPAKKNQTQVYVLLCRPCKSSNHGAVNPILKPSTKALLTRPSKIVVSTKKYPKGALSGRVVRSG